MSSAGRLEEDGDRSRDGLCVLAALRDTEINSRKAAKLQAADELDAVAAEFETLQADFKRLWLAEDRDNDGFQDLVKRFTYTSVACREKAKALRAS